jgi:peroxiredoxin
VKARKADYSTFQALNVQNLGISANNAFSQKTFADSLGLPYPLLSDYPDLRVIRRYGVLQHHPVDPSLLSARRAFFLIDKQGIVRGRWLAETLEVFSSTPMLQRIREIARKP